MFFKTISNKRAFSRKSQNEPTAKQQQQVHFSIIEAILKPEEEKPKISNKLQSLFPQTDKIFQEMPAEIESKNETPISNLQMATL